MSPWYVFDRSSVDLVGLEKMVVKKTEGICAYVYLLICIALY